jgi:arginyl-tRNA synthetase
MILAPFISPNLDCDNFSSSFHKFYGNCKVITDDEKLSQSRLGLINGAKIIISIGLSILGVSAPEKM